MIGKIKYTLSFKITILFILTSLILIGVLWVTLGVTFDRHFNKNISPYFIQYLARIDREIGYPPDFRVAKRIADKLPIKIILETPNRRWSSDNKFIDISGRLSAPVKHVYSDNSSVTIGIYKGKFALQSYQIPYIKTIILKDTVVNKFHTGELVSVFIGVLCIVIVLYWMIKRLFSPISEIEKRVKLIGDGDFSHRLNINRADEIGALSQSINKMTDNLEQILEAKRQLLLAISHELRTPITRSRIALSLMNDSSSKDSIKEDLVEMETLIHELLETERLKGQHVSLDLSVFNINDLVHQVVGRFFADEQINLYLQENIPKVRLDAKRIGLVIKNLVNNAITAQIDKTNMEVDISTRRSSNELRVIVKDKGIGILKEEIEKITEPFYRTDTSRQRKTGGYGIGLYLIKLIVEAHNGKLQIKSERNIGTTITVILPDCLQN